MATNYIDEARKYLQGGFDTAKTNLQNNFNTNMNDLDSQTGQMNKQFDDSILNTKNTGEANKVGYNNNTLSRGMGRSTIATTGLTGIDNQTSQNVNNLNLQRQTQLDNIGKLKDMLRNNLTNSMASAESDYNSKLNEYGMQLRQRDEDVAYRNRQLAEQAASRAADDAFRKMQFDAEQGWKQKDYEMAQEQAKAKANTPTESQMKQDWLSSYKDAVSKGRTEDVASLTDYAQANGWGSLSDYAKTVKVAPKTTVTSYVNPYLDPTGNMNKYYTNGNQIFLNKKYK